MFGLNVGAIFSKDLGKVAAGRNIGKVGQLVEGAVIEAKASKIPASEIYKMAGDSYHLGNYGTARKFYRDAVKSANTFDEIKDAVTHMDATPYHRVANVQEEAIRKGNELVRTPEQALFLGEKAKNVKSYAGPIKMFRLNKDAGHSFRLGAELSQTPDQARALATAASRGGHPKQAVLGFKRAVELENKLR